MNKQLKLVLSFSLFTLIFLNYSSGQSLGKAAEFLPKSGANERCKADQRHHHLMQTDAQYQAARVQVEQHFQDVINNPSQERSMPTVYTIPVVVHIMHLGESVGTGTNISDAQIQSAISNLTDAYGSSNTGTDTDIEFCLAVRDPSGNATSGINRINASSHTSGGDSYATKGITDNNETGIKALSKWDNTKYYNMWIVSEINNNDGASGTQGYAYFPGAGSSVDGAVILYNSFGYDPTGSIGYNLKSYTRYNATTVHEMGHGLNLYHTFQGDDANSDGTPDQCPSNASCGSSSDCCADTDPHRRDEADDCGDSGNSCFGAGTDLADLKTNIMAYSDDACQTKFSADQSARMRATMTGSRASLTTSDGCSPAAPPVSDFTSSGTSACTDVSVDFFDNSQNGTSSWAWAFESGTPTSSTSQNPSASWASGGTYDVSLTASNAQGPGNTETKTDYITVYNAGASYCAPSTTNTGNFGTGIDRFQFETIDNAHTANDNDGTQDFTCSYIAELNTNTSYNFTVTLDGGNTEYCKIYIDYDGDGTYETTELVYSGTSAVSHASSFTTPAVVSYDQVLGMRVISDFNTLGTNACANVSYGEIEDYGVYFTAPAIPPVTDFVADITSGCEGTTVNFTDNSTNGPTSWSWIFEGNGTSTSQNPSKVYNTGGTYDVFLTASNAYGSDPEVKTDYITIYGSPSSYCAVSTTNTGNFGTGIERVQFNTIDNVHTANFNDGTQDFTCSQITELDLNTGYSLTVTLDGGNLEYCKVYIDYNGNGTYESSEVVYTSGGKAVTHTTTITTPASCTYDQVLGMRVISDFNVIGSDPCAAVAYGEVEDYGVYFAAPPCSTAIVDTEPTDQTTCHLGNATFSLTASNALSYQWQESNGPSFINISDGPYYSGTNTATLSLSGIEDFDFDGTGYRCIITGNCNNDTSEIATVTVNPQPSVTSSPSNSSITENTGTSFSVTADNATGYQWQESTGGSFTNIANGGVYSGATTATLTLTSVPASMDGNTYKCIVTNSCGSDTSAAASLTVSGACVPPSITSDPSNSSICESSNTSFSVTAINVSSYQWQLSTGGSFTNVSNGGVYSGATTSTLDLTGVTSGLNGNTYRCIVVGGCSPNDTSTAASLTINPLVGDAGSVTGSTTVCANATGVSYSVDTVSNATNYTWTVPSGATITSGQGSMFITVNFGASAGTVSVTPSNSCGNGGVGSASITLNASPSISSNPSNSTITENNNTSFSVTASNATGYQWQENAGSGFTNITNGGVYSGATTTTLTLTSVPLSMDGNTYRCVVSGNCSPDATSDSASLTVNTGVAGPAKFSWSYDQIYGQQYGINSPTTNTTVFIVPKKVNGASSYTLEINDASDFTGTSYVRNGTGPNPVQSDYYFSSLASNTTWYVRVKVDAGNWGEVRQFTTHNIVNQSFVASTIDGTYGTNAPEHSTDLFCVPRKVDGASSYRVEVNSASDFTGTSYVKTGTGPNITQSQYWFTGLSNGSTYYTRVSIDGGSTWGATISFNTAALGRCNMNRTIDGIYGTQWAANYPSPTATKLFVVPKQLTGVTSYTVEIDSDVNFTAPRSKTGTGPTVNYTQYWFDSLQNSTIYYVRVMTDVDPYGQVYWFTTEAAARPMARGTISDESVIEEFEVLGLRDEESVYRAYPNPFSGVLNVIVDSRKDEALSITVTDVAGKVVYQSEGNLTNQKITFGGDLQRGMYMVQLQHGDHIKLMKVIKQ